MRTAWFTALVLGVARAAGDAEAKAVTPAAEQSRKTPQTARPRPKPRPRPQPTRPPTGRPMEERVADLERENAELRQTLLPPAPAPTEKQQDARRRAAKAEGRAADAEGRVSARERAAQGAVRVCLSERLLRR